MITADKIITIISDYFKIARCNLGIRSRNMLFVMPRHLAIYFIRENTNLSYREIGAYFNRDHATVIHAIKSVNNQVETDRYYKDVFDEIELFIKQEKIKEAIIEAVVKHDVFQENDFYTTEEMQRNICI